MATAAALMLALGLGVLQAAATTPWVQRDEYAHTGYVMSLLDGRLPTLDTRIEVPEGADNMRLSMATVAVSSEAAGGPPHDKVWVANHPPGSYAPALPGAWLGTVVGDGNAVLLAQRWSNILGAVVALGFTALLASEITGSSLVGAVAAGIGAVVPYLGGITSLGLTDGWGLAATMGILWAVTRAVRRGWDRRSTAAVVVLAVACGATRISALATAGVVVAIGLVVTSVKRRHPLWRPTLVIAAAVTALTGWFYVRNIVLYGDAAGSGELLARFGEAPRGSVLSAFFDPSIWDWMGRTLAASRFEPSPRVAGQFLVSPWTIHPLASDVVIAVVLAAAAIVMLRLLAATVHRHRVPSDAPEPRSPFQSPVGWLLLLAAVTANCLMAAQHYAGGGHAWARYVLPAIPAGACAVASSVVFVAKRLAARSTRWLAALLVPLPMVAMLLYNADSLSYAIDHLAAPQMPDARLGPPWASTAATALICVSALVHIGCLAHLAGRREHAHAGVRPRSTDSLAPADA